MARRLTLFILAALVIGIVVGILLHGTVADPTALATIAGGFSILTDLFLRLIKMIIALLVFATLVGGIAHMGADGGLGRIGLRTIGWFLGASLVSLALGLLLVNLAAPGAGLGLVAALPPAGGGAGGVEAHPFSLAEFADHIVPASPVAAMANNEILQIVLFASFFGVAVAHAGPVARPIVAGVEALAAVMLRVTGYVMRFAPVAVFAAVAGTVARQGVGVLATFAAFMGSFYLGLAILWALLFGAARLVVGRGARDLFGALREPFLLAFSTASSEAAFPRTLDALEGFGVPGRIAGFVLPLGYSFNLTGTMMYCTFATIFIAQAYRVPLSAGQQVAMLLLLMVTSKGVAGVPRASLVVIASTLPFFHIPEAGLLLVLAVDHFLDMGRSATNVLGNAVAAAVVAKWEGLLPAPATDARR